ncbi:hypothetical protein DJ013_15015 [Arcticibacterium luteifluviistationis]|uniref:Uncharacterized protein n=1 Tax=Arcticibacterium luteifluviistationis TaxID=1784714 RepID=A0A2Z4GDL2_9BACT|nr:hypothetical protein DJ013_15015 [Arcticibacterium luteifluviistationis]
MGQNVNNSKKALNVDSEPFLKKSKFVFMKRSLIHFLLNRKRYFLIPSSLMPRIPLNSLEFIFVFKRKMSLISLFVKLPNLVLSAIKSSR